MTSWISQLVSSQRWVCSCQHVLSLCNVLDLISVVVFYLSTSWKYVHISSSFLWTLLVECVHLQLWSVLLQVPSSAFSICKVLQKKVRTTWRWGFFFSCIFVHSHMSSYAVPQVFILHNNELRLLVPRGCDISALATLKVMETWLRHDGNFKLFVKSFSQYFGPLWR